MQGEAPPVSDKIYFQGPNGPIDVKDLRNPKEEQEQEFIIKEREKAINAHSDMS